MMRWSLFSVFQRRVGLVPTTGDIKYAGGNGGTLKSSMPGRTCSPTCEWWKRMNRRM
jgi:hypothetical protein